MQRNSLPPSIAPGIAITAYADKLDLAVNGVLPLLRRHGLGAARKGRLIVQLHGFPRDSAQKLGRAAATLRAAIPNVRLWFGIAFDGYVGEYASANTNAARDRIEEVYLAPLRAAHAARVELGVINHEAAGKVHPAAARQLACDVIDGVRNACPGLLLGHTAYRNPTFHPEERNNGGRIDADDEGYPWSAFVGGAAARAAGVQLPRTGRIEVELPQVYAAPPKGENGVTPMARVGDLARILESSERSWDTAERLGWSDPALCIRPYVQAHHVTAVDTCGAGAATDLFAMWASPTRIDAEGELAFAVLCAAAEGTLRLDGPLPGWRTAATAWAQGRVGAKVDGEWGPASTAAAQMYCARNGRTPTSGALTDELLAALMNAG